MLRSTPFQARVADIETLFGRPNSVRLVQVGLYLFVKGSLSLVELSSCVQTIAAYQRSQISDGIPAVVPVLRALLKEVGRFLPDALLRLWLHTCSPYFRYPDLLCPHEFLFLAASAKDRSVLISKLPYGKVSVRPGVNGTFDIDEITSSPAHPDALLETQTAKSLLLSKVRFIGNTEKRPTPRSASHHTSIQDFKREISRQKQKEQLRRTLEDCQQKLNAAKLGGRLAYEERLNRPVQLSQSPKRKTSAVSTCTPQADRSTFFAQVHYTRYVPPHLLFPNRPKFTKVLKRRRSGDRSVTPSQSFESTGSLKHERARSAARLRDWLSLG